MRVIFAIGVFVGMSLASVAEISTGEFRNAIFALRQNVSGKDCRWGAISEPLSFDRMSSEAAYQSFAVAVSNDWHSIVSHLDDYATNQWERLVTIGVGKTFDENFYISACTHGVMLKSQGALAMNELEFLLVSSRTNINTCVVRRFRDPMVTNLIARLRLEFPDDGYWDSVLSGAIWTNRMSAGHNEY